MPDVAEVLNHWAVQHGVSKESVTQASDGTHVQCRFRRDAEKGPAYHVLFDIDVQRGVLNAFETAAEDIPAASFTLIAELISRIHAEYNFPGRLELDWDEGRLRFHQTRGLDLEHFAGDELDEIVGLGTDIMNLCHPAVSLVVSGGLLPADALAALSEGDEEKARQPVESDADAPGWSAFSGSGCLRDWAQELREVCRLSGPDATRDWDLTGRAAILVCDEKRLAVGVLRRVAADAGMRFAHVQDDGVPLLDSLAPFRRLAPALVYLEAGRWAVAGARDEEPSFAQAMRQLQKQIGSWIEAFDPKHPVVLVTAVRDIGLIAESLRLPGKFDRFLQLPPLPPESLGEYVVARIGTEHCTPSITGALRKVGQLFGMAFPTEPAEDLAILRLQRLYRRTKRSIEFTDLLNVCTRGFVEVDEPAAEADEVRRQVAYHEAGHATVAMIDSGGKNVPDYSSIIPSATFKGIVMESVQYHETVGDRLTYEQFRHRVRVGLAGRAAEEIVYGPTRVGIGAAQDLEGATRLASQAFGFWGFAPSMEDDSRFASNLQVAGTLRDEVSLSEAERIEGLVRGFLTIEYQAVKQLLVTHRPLVDAIADRLMWDPIVDAGELGELLAKHEVRTL